MTRYLRVRVRALPLLALCAACSSKPHTPLTHELAQPRSGAPRHEVVAPARNAASPPAHCPVPGASRISAHVAARGLDEISGIVASRAQPGLYWVHNDSGDAPRVYAIDERGALRLELLLRDVTAHDIEDIALVPSPGGADTLYLADVGDNLQTRRRLGLPEHRGGQAAAHPHHDLRARMR